MLLQHTYLEDEKLAGNGQTYWQNCIHVRRILVLDIIGSNANAVSINDFENNLKRYFEKIVFENIKKKFRKR